MKEIGKREHERALGSGVDVPEQEPSFAIEIDRVGIERNPVWVHLPQGCLPFDSSIWFRLPAKRRGIHMSRIEETATLAYSRRFESLKDYARFLTSTALQRQLHHASSVDEGARGADAEPLGGGQAMKPLAGLELSGLLPLVRKTSFTQKESVESLKVFVNLTLMPKTSAGSHEETQHGVEEVMELGIEVEHMTACPCTQAYNSAMLGGQQGPLPHPTHSQRTITRIMVEDLLDRLDFSDLLTAAETALHITQGLLKRPDEAELVLKAHRDGQFVEDVVRNLAAALVHHLGDRLAPEARITLQARSLESIHTHDVTATLQTTKAAVTLP